MNGLPLQPADVGTLDFTWTGLLPAVIQHAATGAVLMLGYMNAESLRETFRRGRVVFYSRSRQKLWEKGETSGHSLMLGEIRTDCDRDALLVTATPLGPVCHLGTATCFGNDPGSGSLGFLDRLQEVIEQRRTESAADSYTARLFSEGSKRIAQKVGEEGLEVALAAVAGSDEEIIGESADLLFHLLVLLRERGLSLGAVVSELQSRHCARG
jgi:phosphoribosyl-AMP cyclohydrolase / phosphoribosyl-ATP pyrophosphohydrolase